MSRTTRETTSWLARLREGTSLITAIVTLISTILGALVVYGSNKGLFSDLVDDMYQWTYKSKEWEGFFNGSPEGYVDMASMNLTAAAGLNLVLTSDGNTLGGIAVDRKLCTLGFPNDFRLVTGKISPLGKSADVQIYDYIGGHAVTLASFSARRDGVVLEITPKSNSDWFNGESIRIAKHPDTTVEEGMNLFDNFCRKEKEEFLSRLKDRPDKK